MAAKVPADVHQEGVKVTLLVLELLVNNARIFDTLGRTWDSLVSGLRQRELGTF